MTTTTTQKRESALFDLPAPLEGQAQLYKPEEAALGMMLRAMYAMEHGEMGGGDVFVRLADLVAALFLNQADWDKLERATLRSQLSDAAFGEFVLTILDHFHPGAREAAASAPTTGPRPTKRAARAVRRR